MRAWRAGVLGLLAAAYGRAVIARNRRLRRPPVLDDRDRPLPTSRLRLSDGETVELIDVGAGPPTLWIPGADGVKESWRHQLPRFARRWRVVAPDLRRSFSPTDTFDRFAEDLAELVDARGLGPAVVIGQSLGGAIAIRFAYRFPELVRGLVLCNTLARVGYEHVGLNRTALVPVAIASTRYLPTFLARALARAWSRAAIWVYDDAPGRDDVIDYVLWTGSRTVPPRISARRVALLERTDLRPCLGAIVAPTLVLKGPRDSYCPPVWAVEIAAGIPGARYRTIPGTGHCSHISDPEAFNDALWPWLEEMAEPGRARAHLGEAGGGRPERPERAAGGEA